MATASQTALAAVVAAGAALDKALTDLATAVNADAATAASTLATLNQELATLQGQVSAVAASVAPSDSPDGTSVLAGSTAGITLNGHTFTITAAGQIADNGAVIVGTNTVNELFKLKGIVYQRAHSTSFWEVAPTPGPQLSADPRATA